MEKQRVKEQSAELSVRLPWTSFVIPRERPEIDEYWAGTSELDVKRSGILEDEAGSQRLCQDIELEECGCPQHAGRPLVHVGDEWQLRMLDHDRVGRKSCLEFDDSLCVD